MKVLKWTAGILFLLAAAWVGLLSLREPWVTPISGVRLEPSRPILREEDVDPDSAFGLLRKACDLWPGERLGEAAKRLGNLDELDLAENEEGRAAFCEELAAFESSLEHCHEAVDAGSYQVPTLLPGTVYIRYLSPAKVFGGVLSARARLRALAGDVRGAVDDLGCALRLSALVSSGGVTANHLAAWVITDSACRGLREVGLRQDCMSPGDAAYMIGVLAEVERTSDSFAEGWRYHWLAIRGSLGTTLYGPRRPGKRASRDRTRELLRSQPLFGLLLGSTRGRIMRDVESCFAHLIKTADEPWGRSCYAVETQLFGPVRNPLLIQDPVGYLIASECVPSPVSTRTRSEWRCFVVRGMRVFLAVRVFETEHGRLPTGLDELTPALLASIPLDPFDGEPIRYGREENGSWRLWSVGPNGRDDGGLGSGWFGVNVDDYVIPGRGWPAGGEGE